MVDKTGVGCIPQFKVRRFSCIFLPIPHQRNISPQFATIYVTQVADYLLYWTTLGRHVELCQESRVELSQTLKSKSKSTSPESKTRTIEREFILPLSVQFLVRTITGLRATGPSAFLMLNSTEKYRVYTKSYTQMSLDLL